MGMSNFVVREAKARQKAVPELDKGVVALGQFHSNFKPKCRVGARVASRCGNGTPAR